MITIPPGPTFVGTSQKQIDWLVAHTSWAAKWVQKGFFAREQPQQEVLVHSFSIGLHPVMVAQYQTFINAGGYIDARYWMENGRSWFATTKKSEPAFWEDERWTGDSNLPVVGVSWYEATAFCNWMGELLGKQCRLPTEIEWEKAAGGVDARLYPWGDCFDAQ